MSNRASLLLASLVLAFMVLSGSALASTFRLPDTGQTKCYQGVSPYAEIPCAGTGQDGAYAINPMSYTDNGDGTVTDNNTGLMWQGGNDGIPKMLGDAATYCDSLILGGSFDWRLPSKKELVSIINYGMSHPAIESTLFPMVNGSSYLHWSSTAFPTAPGFQWGVDFGIGEVRTYAVSYSYL